MLHNFAYYAQYMLHEFTIFFLLSYLNDEIMSISSLFSSSTVWNLYYIISISPMHIDYIIMCINRFIVYVTFGK